MATCLFRNSKTIVVYASSLRSFAGAVQSFSSNAKWGRNTSSVTEETSKVDECSHTVWPDPSLGLFGPRDKRLPLPGNIGLGTQLTPHLKQQNFYKGDNEILSSQLPHECHIAVVSHFLNPEQMDLEAEERLLPIPSVGDILECVAQDCPQLVRKDFADLFPGVDVRTGAFTVVTLCQKTTSDMASWNENVEMEREELMLYFVIAAEEICSQLKDLGFWADFIDPSSGRPGLILILRCLRRMKDIGILALKLKTLGAARSLVIDIGAPTCLSVAYLPMRLLIVTIYTPSLKDIMGKRIISKNKNDI